MHLDESMNSASSSSSTLHDYDDVFSGVGIDERIRRLVHSIRLSARRNKIMHEGEENELKRLHLRLKNLILKDPDVRRQRRLIKLLPTSNRFRELLFYLRKLRDSSTTTVSSSRYVTKMHDALTAVMSQSFEEEYRKTADLLGISDALAEVLICDVELFGVKCSNDTISVRKLIANSLTNLSFGSLQRKRRLCYYPNFIECITKVINEIQALAQAYAALLRNLSWNADPETSKQLHSTVPCLMQASMRAHAENDCKCLCATLSALWNMSFSSYNQQSICQNSRFLEMLVDLLVHDPQQAAVTEAATGVLKYASHCFAQNTSDYMHVNVLQKMLLGLVDLLKSSSFTAINNCLYVLQQLLKYDYQLRAQICINQKAMPILYQLSNSKVLDIKNTVKIILSYLEAKKCQALLHSLVESPLSIVDDPYTNGVSLPYSGDLHSTEYFESAKLLKLRLAKQCSATIFTAEDDVDEGTGSLSSIPPDSGSSHGTVFSGVPQKPSANSMYRNAGVLDHSFPINMTKKQSTATGSDYENLVFTNCKKSTCTNPPLKYTKNNVSEYDGEDIDFDESETEASKPVDSHTFEIEESVRCTRNSSAQSLVSISPTHHLDSCADSANNSGSFSPISASDLPDSPSQFVNTPKNNIQHLVDYSYQPTPATALHQAAFNNNDKTVDENRKSVEGKADTAAIKDLVIGREAVGRSESSAKTPQVVRKTFGGSSGEDVPFTKSADSHGSSAKSGLPSCDILYLTCV